MDLMRAVSYPTRDPQWFMKLLIGVIVSFIPILNALLTYGYGLRAVKMVMNGDDERLPEWDDWGGDIWRGLMVWFGWMIYYLPIMPFVCCMALVGSATTDSNTGDMNAIGFAATCCLYTVVILYSLVVAPILVAASVRYAQTENFNEAFLNFGFRFREVRNHLSATLILMVMVLATTILSAILFGLTIWICGLGLLVAFATNLVIAHLVGQYGLIINDGDYKVKNSYI
jgi:hypothetical protein